MPKAEYEYSVKIYTSVYVIIWLELRRNDKTLCRWFFFVLECFVGVRKYNKIFFILQ